MVCPNCGNELPHGARYCAVCGQDPQSLRQITDPVGRAEQTAGFLRGALRSNSRSWVVRVGRVLLAIAFLLPIAFLVLSRLLGSAN